MAEATAEEASDSSDEAPSAREVAPDLRLDQSWYQALDCCRHRTYSAADSADSAAEAADEVASAMAPETELEASEPSVSSSASEAEAVEVAVGAGASPTAVLGVGTLAWPQTPSPAATAASTSSAYPGVSSAPYLPRVDNAFIYDRQSTRRRGKRRHTLQVARRQPK